MTSASDAPASSGTSTSEQFYGLLTVLLSLFILATVYFVSQYSKHLTRVDVADILGDQLPAEYQIANSLKTQGAKIVELSHLDTQTKIKFMVADEPLGSLADSAPESIMKAILDYQQNNATPASGVPPILVKYGAAQFDYRRVANFEKHRIRVGSQEMLVHTFLSSKKGFFSLLLLGTKLGPTLIVSERLGEPVSDEFLAKFISLLQ